MITEQLRNQFSQHGVVKLSGMIPDSIAEPVRAQIYRLLEKADVCDSGKWTAPLVRTSEDFLNVHSPLQRRLKDSCQSSIRRFNTAALTTAAEGLAGQPLDLLVEKPQLLFTPPNAECWSVPNKVWHVDMPRSGSDRCPGVQMFSFIDEVHPGAGGTVVATGSHRYLNNDGLIRSKNVKRSLRRRHPWFKGLFHPQQPALDEYVNRTTYDGDIALQVVELTGVPGDVYLMDMRLIHSLAPNASNKPRLMVTQRYFPASGTSIIAAHNKEDAN